MRRCAVRSPPSPWCSPAGAPPPRPPTPRRPGAAGRRRQGGHHAAHGVLPRRLDARRPDGAGPAHAALLARARARARRAQGRARAGRPLHGPRRARPARRRAAWRSAASRERNILISASHTHSGPGGYANFQTLNTAAPSLETATDPFSFFGLLDPQPADPQLYRFLVEQISTAIRARATTTCGPAAAGLGLVADPRADREPQHRGAPRRPRDRARARRRAASRTTRAATSTRSTPTSTSCAWTSSCACPRRRQRGGRRAGPRYTGR